MPNLKIWLQAARLRTLPLALSGILTGSAVAFRTGDFNLVILILALVTATFLQVLSNFANDYGDSQNGADHALRKGPQRTVQSGAIKASQMKSAMIFCGVLAFGFGLFMLFYVFKDNLTNTSPKPR